MTENTGCEEYARCLEKKVRDAMSDTRVALISGPRQAGKTTLVKKLTGKQQPYVTFDDESVYQAARSDPVSFSRQFDRVTIDEIQRVPDLIRKLKYRLMTISEPVDFF